MRLGQAGLRLHRKSPKKAQDAAGSSHNPRAIGQPAETTLQVLEQPAHRPAGLFWIESYPAPVMTASSCILGKHKKY